MRRVLIVVTGLSLALAGPRSSAQDKPIRSDKAVERVTVQLAQVNFIAVDRGGRPVLDLGPDEIEVLEGGKLQRIAFLQAYYATAAARDATALPSPTPGPAAPSAPQVGASAESPGRWLILVFDQFLSESRTRLKSIDAAREFVGSDLRPGDKVAMVVFDGKLNVVQNFTSDVNVLRAACDKVVGFASAARGSRYSDMDTLLNTLTQQCRPPAGSPVSIDPGFCAQRMVNEWEDTRMRELDALIVALRTLARFTAPIPDTKAVVLFSEGVARDPASDAFDAVETTLGSSATRSLNRRNRRDAQDKLDSLVLAAAESRVSFFTVNPGGAHRMSAISASRRAPTDTTISPLNLDVYKSMELNAQQGLTEIAQRTGGAATQGADALVELRRMVTSTDGLYTVGYYVRDDAEVTKPRSVKIRVLRRGVRVEMRRDVPRAEELPALQGELTVSADPCSERGRRVITVKLRLERRSLAFERVGPKVSGSFSAYLRILPAQGGRPLLQDFRVFNIVNTMKELEDGGLEDPTVEQTFVAGCKALEVVVGTTDGSNGARREFTESIPADETPQ